MYLCKMIKSCTISKCKWTKASSELNNYRHISKDKLADIVIPKSVNCTNCHCSLDNHKNEINLSCNTVIDSCVSAGKNCIPLTGHNLKKKSVPGWAEQVYSTSKSTIILWHWVWQEAGMLNNGYIYHIMKRTRHQYHYAIRLCKRSKQVIQKQKLAENISHHVDFWKELKNFFLNASYHQIKNMMVNLVLQSRYGVMNLINSKYCYYSDVHTRL